MSTSRIKKIVMWCDTRTDMGFAEYGVRNSEMSVTSGPCSVGKHSEIPFRSFPMHRLALANRHFLRRRNKKRAVGIRRIGVFIGLGTQCLSTTGHLCDHDIHHVTHMATKGGIQKGWRSFHMPAFSSDTYKHGVWGSKSRWHA